MQTYLLNDDEVKLLKTETETVTEMIPNTVQKLILKCLQIYFIVTNTGLILNTGISLLVTKQTS